MLSLTLQILFSEDVERNVKEEKKKNLIDTTNFFFFTPIKTQSGFFFNNLQKGKTVVTHIYHSGPSQNQYLTKNII